jgi:FAD/FMN-containing dehydrogenase
MTRDLILGLEVVTADGTVLKGLRKYIKNNTGIDLKQLFIGSEGTLGVVTRAAVRVFPAPAERQVALCALPSFGRVMSWHS